jgi:hypothetical protein
MDGNMPKYPEIQVELSGDDGNAFYIMAKVQKALRRGKVPQEEIEKFIEEAKSGDYDNLLRTVMNYVVVT